MRAVPPGGWKFLDGGNWIQGHDYESLIDAIIEDRAKNQRPIGDPPKEFQTYVVRSWPHFAGSVSPFTSPVKQAPGNKGKLRERVTQWLANRYSLRASGHTELVSEEEANRRAKICSTCPQNKKVPNDCPPCIQNNNRTSFLLREGKATSVPVEACALMGHDNQTAVFLPEKMLAHRKGYLEEAPSFCWMKTL